MVKRSHKTFISTYVIVFILILAGVLCVYAYYYKYKPWLKSREDLAAVKRVSSILQVPENEEPDVGTVTEVSKLKGQNFFMHAQNGDKVIVYKISGKAILFRPSTGKIIEVAPVRSVQ